MSRMKCVSRSVPGRSHSLPTFSSVSKIAAAAILLSGAVCLSAQEDTHSNLRNEVRSTRGITVNGNDNESGTQGPLLLRGQVIIPKSNMAPEADKGKKAHTNIRFILPDAAPAATPPYSGYAYETPQSLACVYGVVASVAGCNPNSTALGTPSGGSQTIAIVDAYDDPNAYGDLAYFSAQFGIPFNVAKFHVVYAAGYQPSVDYTGNWELEESLDIEYAHAMAPNANLYLVETSSNAYSDLMTGVQVATNLVRCGSSSTSSTACSASATGKGEVSMSWGGSEFASETSYDSYFNGANVVYLASSGDSAGVNWPSASPNVISVGGTTISRNVSGAAAGNSIQENGWDDAGSGISAIEAIPSYQNSASTVKALVGAHRGTPDVASDANPNSGAWVYDSFPMDEEYTSSGWWTVGGTSLAAPTWAGILNDAGTKNGFPASTSAELTKLYGLLSSSGYSSTYFRDETYGACYFYAGYYTRTGYDLCTGLGSSRGATGK